MRNVGPGPSPRPGATDPGSDVGPDVAPAATDTGNAAVATMDSEHTDSADTSSPSLATTPRTAIFMSRAP
ncbi:hypothetical protein GCM10022224_002270 [Nonomuraea antimicrobica]|uniref:Uncharacterized protein n=1 Tax=Nonomuraea antimicrobica TaxID=561173 RepID=A0ABP7AZP2_9ACTN